MSAPDRNTTCAVEQIRPLGQPGDLGWVIMSHGQLYAHEYGWDTTFEALVAKIVVDFATASDEPARAAWVAELAGQRMGCVLCVPGDEPAVAKLRLLLVHPEARGRGLGFGLVDTAIGFAREAGYERMRLWTNHPFGQCPAGLYRPRVPAGDRGAAP